MNLEDFNNLSERELTSESLVIERTPLLNQPDFFYDYAPMEVRSEDRQFFTEDIHSRALFSAIYNYLPSLFDHFRNKHDQDRLLIVDFAEDCGRETIREAILFFAQYFDFQIFRSYGFGDLATSSNYVEWADHYARYEISGRLPSRHFLRIIQSEGELIAGSDGFIYLPHICIDLGGSESAQSTARLHAKQVTHILSELETFPACYCPGHSNLEAMRTAEYSVTLPYITGISNPSLVQLRGFLAASPPMFAARTHASKQMGQADLTAVQGGLSDLAVVRGRALQLLTNEGVISRLGGVIAAATITLGLGTTPSQPRLTVTISPS